MTSFKSWQDVLNECCCQNIWKWKQDRSNALGTSSERFRWRWNEWGWMKMEHSDRPSNKSRHNSVCFRIPLEQPAAIRTSFCTEEPPSRRKLVNCFTNLTSRGLVWYLLGLLLMFPLMESLHVSFKQLLLEKNYLELNYKVQEVETL